MLRNSRSVLGSMDPHKRMRAQAMMKAHQKGKGECHVLDGTAVLRWPASNRKGEGDGYWTSVLSGHLRTCACPSFQHSRSQEPCKHLILLARLAVYHTDEESRLQELEATQVCSG